MVVSSTSGRFSSARGVARSDRRRQTRGCSGYAVSASRRRVRVSRFAGGAAGAVAAPGSTRRWIGSVHRTAVPSPGEDSIANVPWSRAARSRIPSTPNPSVGVVGSKPTPSSRTLIRSSSSFDDLDDSARGMAVLGRIGQRFLDDPVHRELELLCVPLGCSPAVVRELDGRIDDKSCAGHSFCEGLDRSLCSRDHRGSGGGAL